MKIRVPRSVKISKTKLKTTLTLAAFIAVSVLALAGIVYGINYLRYKVIFEAREAECVNFTDYLRTEVLPLTTANVTGCECHFQNVDTGSNAEAMCLCSCILYDENGTLIDDDWNPLFSVI